MRRTAPLALAVFILFHCGPKPGTIRRFMEDGVEIVLNGLEPCEIEAEPRTLILEAEFAIDFGREDIGEQGFAGAVDFEVDSEGSVYFFETNKEGDVILKFDWRGVLIDSFARRGQGPGEVQYAVWTGVDSRDNLIISDNGNRKILTFSKEGDLVREEKFPTAVGLIYPLENGNFIGLWEKQPATAPNSMYMWAFSLYGHNFDELKLLDAQNVYDFNALGTRGVNSRPFFKWKAGGGHLFIASEDRGYEILEYDGEGRLVRKIRKEFRPVAVTKATIDERTKRFEPMGEKPWFPKYWLPISDFFPDDEGRLYVKSFEEGPKPGEYLYDLFNSDGVFVSRKAMNILTLGDAEVLAKARNDRLYGFREKPDGNHEFMVSRMRWE